MTVASSADRSRTDVAIRPAMPADAADLARLRFRFRTELAAPVEDEAAFVARAADWFAARLAANAWRGWVAVAGDDEIIGHVFVQFVEKIPNPVPEPEAIGYLTNFYVVPVWRIRGLGRRLLDAALAACDEAEVDGVIVWPSEESVSLYLRHGFAPPRGLLERPRRP
jgi:GNAT superfamily N-acetyltransferase